MYEPFPGNYIWNLMTNLALMCGGNIGEIDAANRPIREAAAGGTDAGTAQLFESWVGMAAQVEANGRADLTRGRRLSAGAKIGRAAGYLLASERMQSRDYAPRWEAYRKGLALFRERIELTGERCEFVDIAYAGTSFPALYVHADGSGAARPCIVSCNGLDSMKEQIFAAGNAAAFAARGLSTLIVDQPGTGAALRLNGLTAVHDAERWASACIDYLETRSDVDHARIGMFGLSLGGYYAPRAVAFEKRFAMCAVMGANHLWGDLQTRRLAREGENPVPHYWDHVLWVWGQDTIENFMALMPDVTLDGVVDRIEVPFLVTHGRHDRQVPVSDAIRSFDQATASARRELRIFEAEDYEIEHCGADNGTVARDFIADWCAETLAARADAAGGPGKHPADA